MRNRGLVLAGLLLFALSAPVKNTFAQAIYGGIVGNVTDSSGAVVPNAKITVTNVNQGVSFNTTSNASGNYEQSHLIPGVYSVKVEATGFQTFVQQTVQVNVDSVTQVNAVMNVGQVTQEVTVTAAVPLLKTSKTDVSTNFTTRQVVDLPIFNRNFTQLELMTPGTQRLGWQHAASENPQGSIQIMVNGQHFAGTSYQLDGTDNQDPILGIIVINPNLDGVTEAKITTQDYDSEFGQATAGVVTAQTKSGTNELHGTLFEYRRNDTTSARDPFSQSTPIGGSGDKFIPDILYNKFGGSLGGPIKKDKTFIFGDYEGARRKAGGSALVRVPTAAERAGDFTDLGSTYHVFYPYDGSGNVIPCGDIANCNRTDVTSNIFALAPTSGSVADSMAAAQQILSYVPLPNLNPSSPTDPNYSASGNQTFNNDGFDIRVDHYASEKMHILGRYSFQRFARQGPGAFGEEAGGAAFNVDPSLGGFAGQSSVRNQSIAAGFDYTMNPTWLTDFRFGFFRYRVFVNPLGLGTSPASDAGIPGLNLDDYYTSGMPAFFINGDAGFNMGYSLGTNQCNCPLNEQEQQFQFVNNWTNIRGNHTVKFGADIRYAMNLRVPSDSHRAGELSFDPAFTQGVVGSSVGGGVGLATMMLGGVTYFQRYVSEVTDAAERQKRWFFYGQDTWRVSPKLTVNYGMRWEIYFPQTVNGAGNGGWVQKNTGEVWIAGQDGIGSNGNVENTYRNFAPRLGIAYQMNPKTVLRMGYGRSFQIGTFGSIFGHTVTQNLPVLAQQQVTSPANWNQAFQLSQGPPSFDPATRLDTNCLASNGVDPNPITNPGGTPGVCASPILGATSHILYPDGVSPHVHPPKQRMPTVDAWNVTFQRELAPNLSAQIAYVANKGTHGFNGDGPNYDINTATIEGFTSGVPFNMRRPYYRMYGWTQGVQYYGNDASNSYESLQFTLNKRFSNGYSIDAHYTYAHAYQYDGSGYFIYDPSLVRGPSDFQRNHVVVVTQLWQLPFGKGKKFLGNAGRGLDLLIGGWQLNSVWTWETGVPFTPSYSDCGGDIDTGPCRPDLVGNAIPSSQDQNQWFIPASAELASNGATDGPWRRPARGTFGNVGDNSFRGPHFWQTDMSLFKEFKITEKWTGEFRAESFNTFNHVNLGQPNGTVDGGSGGKITGLAAGAAMRQWDFAIRFRF